MGKRARLCVDIGGAKPYWEAWCALHSVTAAEGVRQLVHAVLSQSGFPDEVLTDEHCRLVDAHRERIEIRVTRDEHEAARRYALAGGMSVNRWIVAAIRAQFLNEPQLGEREMGLLADSNLQLVRLVTALGQLPAGVDARTSSHTHEAIRAVIHAHLRTVMDVLRSNLDRWGR